MLQQFHWANVVILKFFVLGIWLDQKEWKSSGESEESEGELESRRRQLLKALEEGKWRCPEYFGRVVGFEPRDGSNRTMPVDETVIRWLVHDV